MGECLWGASYVSRILSLSRADANFLQVLASIYNIMVESSMAFIPSASLTLLDVFQKLFRKESNIVMLTGWDGSVPEERRAKVGRYPQREPPILFLCTSNLNVLQLSVMRGSFFLWKFQRKELIILRSAVQLKSKATQQERAQEWAFS